MVSRFADYRKNLKLEVKISTLDEVLKKAQSTGIVQLSCRELTEIPEKVWKINTELVETTPKENKVIDFSNNNTGELNWWDIKPITKLVLSGNYIKSIDGDNLKLISSVQNLEMRDNQISFIPEAIRDLENLLSFSIANNSIKNLPKSFPDLRKLVNLNLSSNQIHSLEEDVFSSMVSLQQLSLSQNKLTKMPSKLPKSLRRVSFDNNEISTVPEGLLQSLPSLESLDIAHNIISDLGTRSEPKQMTLAFLNLHHNRFKTLFDLSCFTSLKECILAFNMIEEYNLDYLKLNSLEIIDLSHNKIRTIHENLYEYCPALVSLKLSHNDISKVPFTLVHLKKLANLTLSGNPIRNVPVNVLEQGYHEVKKLLEKRMNCEVSREAVPLQVNNNQSSEKTVFMAAGRSLPAVSATGVLDWSVKRQNRRDKWAQNDDSGPAPLPSGDDWAEESFDSLAPKKFVLEVNLSNRPLNKLPRGIFTFSLSINTLTLVGCQLESLPDDLDKLEGLNHLDLSLNLLTSLNPSLGRLKKLMTLKLEANKGLGPAIKDWSEQPFLQEPACKTLEVLSLKMCQLNSCPQPVSLLYPDRMPKLNTLDLTDNNIKEIPDELGLCKQLNYLGLEGNLFRVPRPSLLQQGTQVILEYLKNRIE